MEIEAAQGVMRSIIDQRPFGDSTRKVTSDDYCTVDLRLRGGAMATMTFSVISSGPDEASMLTIYGERGAMRFIGEQVLLSTKGAPFQVMAGSTMTNRPGNSPGGAFGTGTLHLGHALRAALDDGDLDALAPAATFEDGLMQQRVLDAARKSAAAERCWVLV
jgi:predicted dehydrogenase